ncbi:MAG TPA: DUF1269 domain-containing protein [Acidimicrobiales bacterium]|nr:DUF1269 domain-containing protein [Acidimicrobiales bacterium]
MATIVAFSVPSIEAGEEALERLEGTVTDVALIYKNKNGRVKIRQTSDMTVGKGMVRGGLLGGVLSIFAGPLVGMAVVGGAAGGAYAALRDKGVSDKLMKLAGEQLEQGKAAVFVLADDPVADMIVTKIEEAGVDGVEVGAFPAEAANVVKEMLKLD